MPPINLETQSAIYSPRFRRDQMIQPALVLTPPRDMKFCTTFPDVHTAVQMAQVEDKNTRVILVRLPNIIYQTGPVYLFDQRQEDPRWSEDIKPFLIPVTSSIRSELPTVSFFLAQDTSSEAEVEHTDSRWKFHLYTNNEGLEIPLFCLIQERIGKPVKHFPKRTGIQETVFDSTATISMKVGDYPPIASILYQFDSEHPLIDIAINALALADIT